MSNKSGPGKYVKRSGFNNLTNLRCKAKDLNKRFKYRNNWCVNDGDCGLCHVAKYYEEYLMENIHQTASEINSKCANLGLKTTYRGKQKDEYWLPAPLKKLLVAEAQRPDEEKTHIAVVKYFNPSGAGTWWISEYHDRGDEHIADFFGKCKLNFPDASLGYVNLKELRDIQLRFGLFIERDYHWVPKPLTEVV